MDTYIRVLNIELIMHEILTNNEINYDYRTTKKNGTK